MVMAIKRHMNPAIDLDLFKHDPLNRYKTLLFDCTDNAHTQKAIFEATNQQTHIRYEKIGYEGFKVGSYSDYQAWIPDNYQPGYRTSVANSLSSSFAAIIGLLKVLMDHREDCNINILKLIKGETDAESKRVAQ